MNKKNYDCIFKIILAGDSCVGKSNIFSYYLNSTFEEKYEETIGAKLGSKIVEINNKKIKLQIWDISGKEEYRQVINVIFKDALGSIIIYDITQKQTFHNIDKWIKDIKDYGDKNISILLIGNKSDLSNKREVLLEEGINKSKKFNTNIMETSALNGEKINEAFNELINKIYQTNSNYINHNIEFEIDKTLNDAPPAPSKFQKYDLANIYLTCTECNSEIELISINEKYNNIIFRCLNTSNNHYIINIDLKEYFKKITNFKEKNINAYQVECKKHLSYKDNSYVTYCLDCKCHLCKECLKTREHFNHRKNNIIEIRPREEELNIIKEVIKDY